MAKTLVETFNFDDRSQDNYAAVVDPKVALMNMTLVQIETEERISIEEVSTNTAQFVLVGTCVCKGLKDTPTTNTRSPHERPPSTAKKKIL